MTLCRILFGLAFLLLSAVNVLNGQTCDVTIQLTDSIAVREGDTTCFQCVISGQVVADNVIWSTGSQTNVVTDTSPVNGRHVQSGQLIITDASNFLDGSHFMNVYCSAVGTTISERVYPEGFFPPSVTTSGSNMVNEGGSVTLICTDNNIPGLSSLQWLDPQGNVLTQNIVATLTDIQRGEAGEYECRLTNVNDNSVMSAFQLIIVQYTPSISSNGPQAQYTKPNSNFTLSCVYDSVPVSDVTWFHNGHQLVDQDSATVINIPSSFRSELHLTSITIESNGNYSCMATNVVGSDTFTTRLFVQEPPNAPTNVKHVSFGSRWIVVCWTPAPFELNRPVTTFNFYISSVDGPDNYTLVDSKNASDFDGLFIFNISSQDSILPYTNYSMVVVSCNEVGCSYPSLPSDEIRTLQDFSSQPVGLNGELDPADKTVIVISWSDPLQENGIITQYNVDFTGRQSYNSSFSHTRSLRFSVNDLVSVSGIYRAVLSELVPGSDYDISVTAVNGAGVGESASILVDLPDIFLVQLRLVGVDDCKSWVADGSREKIDTINQSLVVNIEERCQCGFTHRNIMSPKFRCYPDSDNAVTYRAEVTGTDTVPTRTIISRIEEWLTESSSALVSFDVILVPIDGSCPVVVSSIADPECDVIAPAQSDMLTFIISGAAGGVAVLLIATLTIAVICTCACMKARAKKRLKIETINPLYKYGQTVMTQSKQTEQNQEVEYEELNMYKKDRPRMKRPDSIASTDNAYSTIKPLHFTPNNSPLEYHYVQTPVKNNASLETSVSKDFAYSQCEAYTKKNAEQQDQDEYMRMSSAPIITND